VPGFPRGPVGLVRAQCSHCSAGAAADDEARRALTNLHQSIPNATFAALSGQFSLAGLLSVRRSILND
jgi:hypothetical protein